MESKIRANLKKKIILTLVGIHVQVLVERFSRLRIFNIVNCIPGSRKHSSDLHKTKGNLRCPRSLFLIASSLVTYS